MQPGALFYTIPLLALFCLTVLVLFGAVELGFRVGRWSARRGENEKDAPIGGLVAATLGLLAFLLAFTFGAAANRYDSRKELVLREANAIGTAYLRADLLSETLGADARATLVEYTRLRAQGVTELLQPEANAKSSALQAKLWATATAAGKEGPELPVTALFIEAVNELIDLSESRITAGRNHIPDVIWLALYLLTIFSMAAMGYQFGLSGVRSWGEEILLVLAFAVVILLIADLDRPQGGLVRVSQQPLLDLLRQIAPGN
jgi:hypothetical protein